MNENFLNTAIQNINLIKNSTSESVCKSDFIYINNNEFSLNELIKFLVVNDYIETEKNDDVYFLTAETYKIIECFDLEMSLWLKIDIVDDEVYPELTENEIKEIAEENKNLKRESKITYYTMLFLMGATITWYLYDKQINKNTEVPKVEFEKIIKEFKNVNHKN